MAGGAELRRLGIREKSRRAEEDEERENRPEDPRDRQGPVKAYVIVD
jgi:hypothetical protein